MRATPCFAAYIVSLPEWLRGGLKIHCRQLRMGSNPKADVYLMNKSWDLKPAICISAPAKIKKHATNEKHKPARPLSLKSKDTVTEWLR